MSDTIADKIMCFLGGILIGMMLGIAAEVYQVLHCGGLTCPIR